MNNQVKMFFTKMTCIVRMDQSFPSPIITEEDRIVRVEKFKISYIYTVYYFHRIYNDDRIYKCSARFKTLPEFVQKWMMQRDLKENGAFVRWEEE